MGPFRITSEVFSLSLAIASLLLMVSCASGEPSSTTSSQDEKTGTPAPVKNEPAPPPTSTAPERTEPPSTASTVPLCENANPLAAQENLDYQAFAYTTGFTGEIQAPDLHHLAGPVAQNAWDQAAVSRTCVWPLYIAGNTVQQHTAILATDIRDELIEGLRASDYVENTMGEFPLFTYELDDPENYRMVGSTHIDYLFAGDAWIAVFETGQSNYAQSALEALVAANPGLDE